MYSLANSFTYCRNWGYCWDCPSGFCHPGSSPTHQSVQTVPINWSRHNRQLSDIPTWTAVAINQLLCYKGGKRSAYHLVSSQSITSYVQRVLHLGTSWITQGAEDETHWVHAQIQCWCLSISQTLI